MRAYKIVLAWVAAAAAAACGDRVESATVEIEARPVSREAAAAQPGPAVKSGHHVIEVRRTLGVADPCRDVTAGLVHAGGYLTLRVVAEPDGRDCPPAETFFAYTARIEDLPPGRYNLRVVHVRATRGGSEVALKHPVVVMERSVNVQ